MTEKLPVCRDCVFASECGNLSKNQKMVVCDFFIDNHQDVKIKATYLVKLVHDLGLKHILGIFSVLPYRRSKHGRKNVA